MLRTGTMKVTEAAQKTGYGSDAAFRPFKVHFGYAPSEARRNPAKATGSSQ